MNTSVGIVGAGIGGLTTALALHAQGLTPRIFERAGTAHGGGAGIVMPANALKVFAGLGLAERVIAAGNPIRHMRTCDRRDRTLGGIDLHRVAPGLTSVAIARKDLADILRTALPDDVIVFDKKATGADTARGELTLESGATERFDLLVGADGLNSTIRKSLGVDVARRDTGQWCLRGVTRFDGPQVDRPELRELWGRGLRFGYVGLGRGRIYWYATFSHLTEAPEPGMFKPLLAAALESWAPIIGEILRAQTEDDILLHRLADKPPAEVWHQGRVVLLGDAIHPTTPNLGQGAAMAVESAGALAHHLARHPGRLDEALAGYVAERRPRTADVTRTSWRLGQLANLRSGWASALRNAAFWAMPDGVSAQAARRLLVSAAPG